MADQTPFDARLADTFERYFAEAPTAVDAAAVAASVAMRTGRPSAWRPLRAVQTMRPLSRLALVVLVILSILAVALAAGGSPLHLGIVTPSPVTTVAGTLAPAVRPLVEELGQFSDANVSGFGATVLESGRVLVVGGANADVGQQAVSNAWVFDPTTKQISATGDLVEPRARPVVVALPDGRALVFGGWYDVPVTGTQLTRATAELYDPVAGTFSPTASLPEARINCPCGALDSLPWAIPNASLLHDGRVFLSGGSTGRSDRADVFDPGTEEWTQLDVGCDASRGPQTLLRDGRLLLLCVTRPLSSHTAPVSVRAHLFDPATNTFTDAAAPPAAARVATVLPDGRVLLTGFGAMIYDPRQDTFKTLQVASDAAGPPVAEPGFDLGDGRILFLGGYAVGSSHLFDTEALSFRAVPDPRFAIPDTVLLLRDGRLLTIGYKLDVRLLDPLQLP